MKIKSKIILLMASALLVGCEINTEVKQEEKKEEKLYVEQKEVKKDVSELPKGLYMVKEEKEKVVYKDPHGQLYLVIGEYFYEGQEAIAKIETEGILDYSKVLDVKKNISEVLNTNKEIILIEDDEEKEKVIVEKDEKKYEVLTKNTSFTIERKEEVEEKEVNESETEEVEKEIEEWEKEVENVIKHIQTGYYENSAWLGEVQELLNYANKRWKIIEDGEEYSVEIDGDEYIEQNIESIEEEYKERIEKRKIKIVQYKNNGIYELDYIIHDGKKNKESKKIIIKEKEEKNEEVLSQ